MARTLSGVAAKQFDTEVKHAYQSLQSKLKKSVSLRTGVVGDTYNFRAMGKGLATVRSAPSSDVVPMNVEHSLIACTMSNIIAAEYTDVFDAQEVNFSEVSELAQVIAGSLSRKEDQFIIDALSGSGTTKTVDTNVGGSGSGLNVAKLRRAAKLLNDDDVPMEERFFVITSGGLDGLLSDPTLTSADYNTVKALVNGEVDTFMGFGFIMIGSRSEGGLPFLAPSSTGYAFHKMAVGYAEGLAPTTQVEWVPQKQSWLSVGKLKGGAVARDKGGIVAVTYKENV